MAYNLYYLRYNNYFNRKTIPHIGHSWFTKYQIGAQAGVELFNFGDGIDTTQLVNTNLWANPDSVPNYLIVQSDTDLNDYTRWYITHFDYIRQGQYRATLKRDALAENYDLIIGPTNTNTAYKFNEHSDDALKCFYDDLLTIPVNMTGLPALSMPVGFNHENMPIGMHIIGNYFEEAKIYQLAQFIEKELNLSLEVK